MKNKKKVIFDAILFFGIFAATIWSVFHGEDLRGMKEAMLDCEPLLLIPAILCVFIFIFGESIIIWYLMRSFGIKVKEGVCFLFSSIGFFFSCVTPSASGGQPMQIYYMKKYKIPVTLSAVILLIVTITYKLVLVVLGIGMLIFGGSFRDQYLTDILPVFYLGIFLNVVCVAGMILLLFHPSLARRGAYAGIHLLERMHILKHRDNRLAGLEASMDNYHEAAAYIKEHHLMIVHVFVITFLQRLALFAVPCFVYKAFHLSGTSWTTILGLQASISISVDMLPLPGGMGISEKLFELIFDRVFGELILPGMVLSRGLGYYSELLISAIFTLVAVAFFSRVKVAEWTHFASGKNKKAQRQSSAAG